MNTGLLPLEAITQRIILLREQKVLLDADLAALYGVETKRLNEQVRRNAERFPADFMITLNQDEWEALRSQFATLKTGRGQHRKYLPYAFTEHGAIMAAMVLNSPQATEVSVYVVRAFVKLREVLASHRDLAQKLEELEQKAEALAMRHDAFARNTRMQLKQVFEVIQELMEPPEPAKKRPIGFITTEEKLGKAKINNPDEAGLNGLEETARKLRNQPRSIDQIK
jgi:phage regulator Rha-like protein